MAPSLPPRILSTSPGLPTVAAQIPQTWEVCNCFKFLCAILCPHCAHGPWCWWRFVLSGTHILRLCRPHRASFLREVKKKERRTVIREWSGQMAWPAQRHWVAGRHFEHLSWATSELHTSLRAPEAEPPPAGQFFILGGFYKMQKEQDSSPFSLQLKKKILPSLHCFVPYKKRIFVKSTISRT